MNQSVRSKLYEIESNPNTRYGRYFAYSEKTIVLLYCLVYSLDTLPNLTPTQSHTLSWAENIFVIAFSIQYLITLYATPSRLKYTVSFYGLVDLISVFPFYLFGLDLQVLRALRLVRFLKLHKFDRAFKRMSTAIKSIKNELILFSLLSLIMIFFSAIGIYFFEHDTQPDVFTSVFHSIWWSIVTLTTVGYGDAYPVTVMGKAFAALIMIFGIGLVAVPTSLFASAFGKMNLDASRKRLIVFGDSRFCVIGTPSLHNPQTNKNYTKNNLETTIKFLGGQIDRSPALNTNYLVVCCGATTEAIKKETKLGDMQIITDVELIDTFKKTRHGC